MSKKEEYTVTKNHIDFAEIATMDVQHAVPEGLQEIAPFFPKYDHLNGLYDDIQRKLSVTWRPVNITGSSIEKDEEFTLRVRVANLRSTAPGHFKNLLVIFRPSSYVKVLTPGAVYPGIHFISIPRLNNGSYKYVYFKLKALDFIPSYDPNVKEDIGSLSVSGQFDYENYFRVNKSIDPVEVNILPF